MLIKLSVFIKEQCNMVEKRYIIKWPSLEKECDGWWEDLLCSISHRCETRVKSGWKTKQYNYSLYGLVFVAIQHETARGMKLVCTFAEKIQQSCSQLANLFCTLENTTPDLTETLRFLVREQSGMMTSPCKSILALKYE